MDPATDLSMDRDGDGPDDLRKTRAQREIDISLSLSPLFLCTVSLISG